MKDYSIIERINHIYDYEGFTPQVLKSYTPEDGEIVSFEKDVNKTSFVINKDLTIGVVEKGTRVFPLEFIIEGKGDTLEKAVRDFIRKDTLLCIKLMLNAVGDNIYPVSNFRNLKDVLEQTQWRVEKNRYIADKFIIGREQLCNLSDSLKELDYDPVSSRSVQLNGSFGTLWGVSIFVETESLLDKCVFCVAEGRCLGSRYIRDIDYSSGKITVLGGMCIFNPRAISCAVDNEYTTSTLNVNKIFRGQTLDEALEEALEEGTTKIALEIRDAIDKEILNDLVSMTKKEEKIYHKADFCSKCGKIRQFINGKCTICKEK